MQSLDFNTLLEQDHYSKVILAIVPPNTSAVDDMYVGGDGILFQSRGARREVVQDIVRLEDEALLFASDHSFGCAPPQRQTISGSDWIHIQLRMRGGGSENISEGGVIATPERSCVISRYPRDSVIERRLDPADRWKAVCLLMSPRSLTSLLDVQTSALSASTRWLGQAGSLQNRSQIVPLQPAMALAANDILSCSLRGPIRRAYMRAKAIELLAVALTSLESTPASLTLTARDLEKLALARTLMDKECERRLTLAELAARVSLSRTKLALGFKSVYNATVQAYWRDVRLTRARTLLAEGRACVTEIALETGYSELSSFTRAFHKKFKVLPRDCRSAARVTPA